MTLKILAYGANGAQMAGGTQALAEAGHEVTAFTRSEQGAARWKAAGVKTLAGHMNDEAALRSASEGQDAIFLHVPLITDPNADRAAFGLNALKAAKAAGVTRVVWNTGGPIMDSASTTDPAAILLRALQEGSFSFLGLTPVTYMENLAGPWTVSGLAEGRLSYPTPESFKMSWVAAADFGRVADKSLQGQLPNEVIALGGPAALDGTDLARIMGETLGLDLTFDTMAASNFEAQLGALAGPDVAGTIGGLYGGIQANPDQFQPGFLTDAGAIEKRFGLELTSLADWVSQNRTLFSN